MKKGRHRRFEEARARSERSNEDLEDVVPDVFGEVARRAEPCVECGAEPGDDHASWCLATEDEEDEELEEVE